MSSPRSSQRIEGERLINQLTDAVSGYQATAKFSCSGSVDVRIEIPGTTRYGNFTSTKKPITSPPIDIRWDASSGNLSKKITFPVRNDMEKVLQQLVEDCQPATFGFDGKDVFDEKIRKAGKLEARQFSTSFNPYDFGILDKVAQALLPGIIRPNFQDKDISTDRWGVVAELYKLNVYSAPSDMFKPHVDTPRGLTLFGSLVVCLPNPFKGGQLRVAHKGVERLFDLQSSSFYDSSIHWAAFYSDCEHEVLPVTSGHRVTLTYQLYVSEHLSGLMHPQFPTTDPKLQRLYQSITEILSSPQFIKNGGILGFRCAHQYAHATCGTYFYPRYAHTLEGIDAALVTIFRTLSLTVHVEPVYSVKVSKEIIHPRDIITARFRELMTIEEEMGKEEGKEIGEELKETVNIDSDGSGKTFRDIKWFNRQADHNVETAYHEAANPVWNWIGNEIEIDWWYSFKALLVEIPIYSKRELKI